LKVLGVLKVPVISYWATSDELSDKSEYEYFSRTIPSDMSQVKAIVDVLDYFNWTYVSIVYTDESYGRYGFEMLKMEATKHGT
jgi:ABC-type branched-subunit amino acid transport system substrate-binding protein